MEFTESLLRCSLFAQLSAKALSRLAGLCSSHNFRGGETLFRSGDPASCLYVVLSGRIRIRQSDGTLVGDVGRYEPIGEVGVLTSEPRSADAHALRDSQLLRIGGAELMGFVMEHPAALLEMSRVIVGRLRRNQRHVLLESARREQSIAVIALSDGVDVTAMASRLCAALNACGALCETVNAAIVDAALGAGTAQASIAASESHLRLMQWLDAREQSDRHLVYGGGPDNDPWAERCLRQCDRVVVLVQSRTGPTAHGLMETLRQLELRAPVDLVVLRPEGSPAGDIMAWRLRVGASSHYFLRPGNGPDLSSLARQISGRGLGLVLGGGGARGFAHIGLLRALEHARLPIDLVGGTSMGAFFAALHASGLDSREAQQVARDTFVTHNYLNDYVLPRVSLIRGRKFVTHLQALFGTRQIEGLGKPCFFVSTNLSRASTVVHDSGPVAMWVATSMAVPGVAPPVVWKADLLVDGAVTNSLPTDVMQGLARGQVVASDVSTDGGLQAPGIEGPDAEALLRRDSRRAPISLIDILFGGMSLTSESGVRARAARADLYLRMPVSGIGLFDWKRLDGITEIGYRHAMEALEKATAPGAVLASLASTAPGSTPSG